MAGREAQLFERIQADPVYQRFFSEAFPGERRDGAERLFSLSTLTRALASFQRSLLSFNSPWDRFRYRGEKGAISDSARRGEALFFSERLECYHCHGGLNFTDNLKHSRLPAGETGFHNTGLYDVDGRGAYPAGQTGLHELTGDPGDIGRFRTPSLRNVAVTAPYMHDGSIPDLRSVIREHYAPAGKSARLTGQASARRSELIIGFDLNDQETDDLVEFLKALTDPDFLTASRHADPWEVPGERRAQPVIR
ncbi:MAG: Cytochrome peroxidase precursor [Pseudomonadota bacterium]|jgi:cytochrome c peroxidase